MILPFSFVRPHGAGWLVLFATLAAAHVARGQQSAPTVAKSSGKEYALAHSSSFDAPPGGARNPFWPIGWTPTMVAGTAQTTAQQIDVKPEQFVVTTISVDYPPLAIINGRSYAVGDQIPVTADKRVFVTVKQILDGVVVLDYQGHELRSTTSAGGMARKLK